MSEITITPMEPRHYGVQVSEGPTTTSHRVAVTGRIVDDLRLDPDDGERIVRETIGFLLEREPATAILAEFSLADVDRYFPAFRDELTTRLGAG
jgi:hypothetical protein